MKPFARMLLVVVWYALGSLLSVGAAAQPNATGKYFRLDNYTGSAHELALAVERQQAGRIRKLLAVDSALANAREPSHGITLLQYAVMTGRYQAAEALLEGGANPNLCDTKDGRSPMHEAAHKYNTSKFLALLLSHGGNPNLETTPAHPETFTSTPLLEAIPARRESVELLLRAGADLNHVTRRGHDSAIGTALMFEKLALAQYFLFEKKADYAVACGETVDRKVLYIANVLRNITPKVDSEEWRQKQQIVTFLTERGVDYNAAPIPYGVRHSFGQGYIDAY
jgi:hypothetical protein